MFFNKKKNEEFKEQPLGYWEEKSYMLVIPENPTNELLESVCDRVSSIEGIKIIKKEDLKDNEPGKIKLSYENEEYEIGYYPSKFSVPELYINKGYYFSESEMLSSSIKTCFSNNTRYAWCYG